MKRSGSVLWVLQNNMITLQEKVHKKIATCLKKAEKHYGMEFIYPRVIFSNLGVMGGLCEPRITRDLIEFNIHMLSENPNIFISETVPHEIAHSVAFAIDNYCGVHGKLWKEVMVLFNAKPNKYHNYSIDTCFKKAKKKERLACSKCLQTFTLAFCKGHRFAISKDINYKNGNWWHKKCNSTLED